MKGRDSLDAAQQYRSRFQFWPNVDGLFIPKSPREIYGAGKQANVPLLAGRNTDEQPAGAFFGKDPHTVESYTEKMKSLHGEKGQAMLKLYPAGNDIQMNDSACPSGHAPTAIRRLGITVAYGAGCPVPLDELHQLRHGKCYASFAFAASWYWNSVCPRMPRKAPLSSFRKTKRS